jgi:hypothetical protein
VAPALATTTVEIDSDLRLACEHAIPGKDDRSLVEERMRGE